MICFTILPFLSPVPARPRRLLILINPRSGKFKGREMYEKQVAPIFNLANVSTDVICKFTQSRVYTPAPNYDSITSNHASLYHVDITGIYQ